MSAADRQASGRVQPNIEERKTATASPDKLTLSKGLVKGAAPEAQIARARQGKEEKERVAELSKNISELSRLQDKAAATGAASPASASRGPTVAVGSAASAPKAAAPATSASAGASAPAASAPSSPWPPSAISSVKPGTATAPLAAASTAAGPSRLWRVPPSRPCQRPPPRHHRPLLPTRPPPAPSRAHPPSPPPVQRLPQGAHLQSQPPLHLRAPRLGTRSQAKGRGRQASTTRAIAPGRPAGEPGRSAAAGGLLALLAGLAFYRARQRKKSSQVDSSFLESRMQPRSAPWLKRRAADRYSR